MAALVHGEWPAHLLAVDPARGRATVRFLGGSAPEGLPPEATVAAALLVRPGGGRHLDLRLTRHWTTRRPWTGAALRALRLAWPRRPAAEVAGLLGRSEQACALAMQRWWGHKARRAPGQLSLRGTARVLGVDDHRVRRLVAAGLLPAAPSGVRAGPNERWCVLADDLEAFLAAHPEHYDPERLAPGRFRRVADRAAAEGPLLTVAEAAARACVAPETIRRHVRRGWLPAVWAGLGRRGTGTRGWRVRASALERFAAYPDEARLGGLRRLLERRGLLSVAEAARRLGVARTTLQRWIRRDGYPAARLRRGRRWVYGVTLPPRFHAGRSEAA
jgi:excisionase family DNA binding protein